MKNRWGVALLVAAMTSWGCGDDEATGPDAGGVDETDDVDPALLDDTPRAEVVIPSSPRAWRAGAGISAYGAGTPWWDATLRLLEQGGENVVLHVDGRIPWGVLAQGEPPPTAWLAPIVAAADDARARGLDIILLVDVLAPDRRGLVADLDGGAPPAVADAAPAAGRLAAALVEAVQPVQFASAYEFNRFVAQEPDRLQDAIALHAAMRRAAQDVAPQLIVAVVHDAETLRESLARESTVDRAYLARTDELTDLFGLRFAPTESLRALDSLGDGEFATLSGRSTRPVVVYETWWPAAGFVRGDEVFASSENTQFNYLGWLARAADRLPLRGVAWTPIIDATEWLRAPCATDAPGCDEVLLRDRWGARGAAGLRRADGRSRAGIALWESMTGRPLP